MTDVASALPSAGWYDDPSSDSNMRWWDGRGWTDNSMPKPASIPEPTAPPLGIAYSVDEQRATDTPRRSARPRGPRSDDGLATIVQLHPGQVGFDLDTEVPSFSHPVDPLPVVPPVTVPQDAARILSSPVIDVTHLPQLGRVPDEVFAPEAVAVAVVIEDHEPLSVPAPGSLVSAPEAGSTVDVAVPEQAVAVTLPVGLPTSPAAFAAEPEPTPVVQAMAAAPRQNADWWLGLIPSRSSSGSARLLALSPFFSIGAMAAVAFIIVKLPEFLLATLAIPMLALVLPIVLAALDRRALHELGWDRQAGVLWAVLGPFWYLIARQVVLARQGAKVAPLIVGAILISGLAPVVLVVATQMFEPQFLSLIVHLKALSI